MGTGLLTKDGAQVSISNIPAEYQIIDKNQLLQWPDKVTVQKISSVGTRTINENSAISHSKQRNKVINYVDRNGNYIGTGSMSMDNSDDKIKLHDVPNGYKATNLNQVLDWPDTLIVEKEQTV